MKATVRRLLAVTAISGLAASLAACGQSATQQGQTTAAVATPTLQPGWSMTDLAQLDPSALNASAAPLPQAVPMQASASTSYQQAPSVDYSGGADVSYVSNPSPDDYQFLGMAAGLTGMLGEAPPDYGFDYNGVRPWAWQTADHYIRYAEPVSDGYRYYYYQPNATRPFLISDPYYSYGYRDGQLVTIYDRSGRMVDTGKAARERQAAQAYFARGAQMYQAAHREQHVGVAAPLWQKHRDEVAREQRQLADARQQRQAWQQWDANNDPKLRRDWASEAVVRRQAETTFDNWQKADFRTPPPRLYTDQQRRADLQKLADIRRRQQAQRTQQAQRAAQQRSVVQQKQEQKLAQQRQQTAQRQQMAQQQQQQRQAQAHQQNAQQARLQAQRQAQTAEAARIDPQKASADRSRQAAERNAQQAKNSAQKAQQAKLMAEHKAAAAKATVQKAQHQAQQAKATEQKVDQKAQQAKAAAAKAQQAKAAAQHAAQQAAQAKAKQASAARRGPAPQAAERRSPKAQANSSGKGQQAHKPAAAAKNGKPDKKKHDDRG